MANKIDCDVIVVGAGLVGLAAAIALANQHKNVVLVSDKPVLETKPIFSAVSWDERVYALTSGTEAWLKSLDIWDFVDESRVNTIDSMHIWGAETDLVLNAADANVAKLGLIIENQQLMTALWRKLEALDVTVVTDARCTKVEHTLNQVILHLESAKQINAKLIVAADGLHSWVRQQANIGVDVKNYDQVAVVANFLAENLHYNEAKQWFNAHDILALLPLPNRHVSMVWSVSTEKAAQLLALTDDELCEQVQMQSQELMGKLKKIGQVRSAALKQQTASQLIGERVVLVGDAAHQVHPMAGQGVNLGFRDVMELAQLTTKLHAMHDIGERAFLRQFERARKADVIGMNSLTSGLDYLFATEQTLLKKLSNWGLQGIARQPSLKKLLIKQAAH
ncbi:MAG: FAD-dependent monooxygenase [Pseudomonadota bacterium]